MTEIASETMVDGRYRVLHRSTPSPFEAGRALWWPRPLDVDALHACAAALVGTHDFTAFTPTQTEHVRFERRVLSARWVDECEAVLVFEIEADAFMRQMNRVLVGTMLEVAGGRRSSPGVAVTEGQVVPPGGEAVARIREAFPALGGPHQATLPEEARRLYYPVDHQETIRRVSGRRTRVTVTHRLPRSADSLTIHHHGGHQASPDHRAVGFVEEPAEHRQVRCVRDPDAVGLRRGEVALE